MQNNSSIKQLTNSGSYIDNSYATLAKAASLSLNGPYQYHSSATLRNSIPEISFAKEQRLKERNYNNYDVDVTLPSIFDVKKGTTFGFGNKKIQPDWVEKNAKVNPAPDSYNANETSLTKLSFAFGGEAKFNQKRFIHKSQQADKNTPGVGEYDVSKIVQEKPGKSILDRFNPLPDPSLKIPAPNAYQPTFNQVELTRFAGVGMGFGNKTSFDDKRGYPGPGSYEAESAFKTMRSNPVLRFKSINRG